MPSARQEVFTPHEVVAILRQYWRRWLIPAAALAVIAAGYALVRPATWEASQALMVRDEAVGGPARPGKFQQLDDMKAVQETILELIRSRSVLSGALAKVGPDSKHDAGKPWPTDAAILDLGRRVKLTPPKGAEFGKTEIFYLEVEAESPTRAVELAAAICDQVQARSQAIRDQKASGLIAELSKTVELARKELSATTADLTEIESRVGADLGELRLLNEISSGDSPLRRAVNEMELELRQARQAIEVNEELISLLKASKNDPQSLVAAPNRLLEAQPALRRLKDGLVDAQLRTSQLAGNMSDTHPLVIAAKNSEQEITAHVRSELDSSIRGVEAELRLAHERKSMLESQLADAKKRLVNVAEMRADYANLVAARNHRTEILKEAEQQLAEARASQAGANAASLITAIDAPVAGEYPVGPGKASIVLGGWFGGLLIGFGILFLTVPTRTTQSAQPETDVHAWPQLAAPTVADTQQAIAAQSTSGHLPFPSGLSLKQALRKLAVAR